MHILQIVLDKDIYDKFEHIAEKNNTNPEIIINDFIKDYVVSDGHPEKVTNCWPWSKK